MQIPQKHIQLYLIIGGILLLNLVGSRVFSRIDLTEEKRFTLSEVGRETALKLDKTLYVSIYLAGDFSPNIRRFQDAIRTTLIELGQYSADYLKFEFIDPSENPEIAQELNKRGFVPIPVTKISSVSERSQKIMYSQALFSYGDKEKYVDLLKGSTLPDGSINFSQAEADLEYKLVSAMRAISKEKSGVVAILQGHGETPFFDISGRPNPEVGELVNALENAGYEIGLVNRAAIEGLAFDPTIDVLLVLQPSNAFTERDKYELDQYLQRGGSIFFIFDQQRIDWDLAEKMSTVTFLRELNLDDLLMQVGLKVNYDLVLDLNAAKIELFSDGPSGGQYESIPWIYYPMIYNLPDHPVSRNVDAVQLRYASSVDTLPRKGIRKSIFLQSNPESRKSSGANFIDVNTYVQNAPPPEIFNEGPIVTGVLAEGTFPSLFTGRKIPVDSLSPDPPTVPYIAQGEINQPGKVGVISDGEFYLGREFRGKRGFMPADNKALLMNVIDYLAGDDALTQIRSKEVVIRNLDKNKVKNNIGLIRLVNIVLPILFVLAYGFVRYYLRKRKHAQLQTS